MRNDPTMFCPARHPTWYRAARLLQTLQARIVPLLPWPLPVLLVDDIAYSILPRRGALSGGDPFSVQLQPRSLRSYYPR